MSKWWPTILAALGAAGAVFVPVAQAAITAHPIVDTVLLFAYSILTHILPSPVSERIQKG